MKTKLFAVALLAGGALFAQTRVQVGIGIGSGYGPGAYAPAPYAQQVIPPCPGPDYAWVNGYWSSPNHGRNSWVAGYWAKRPAYSSYRNDRDRNRNDFNRDRDHDRDRGRSDVRGSGFVDRHR